MQTFRCQSCRNLLFFENTQCLKCGATLGYLPDRETLSALEPGPGTDAAWQAMGAHGGAYRRCGNYARENVCNWMIPVGEDQDLCLACRLNRTIPNLSQPEHRLLWARLEAAKRRLVYTLLRLELPVMPMLKEGDGGLAFDFLAEDQAGGPVTTGHANGLITLNIGEADDAVREANRQDLGELYRTLLGHFRHEIGHYYWDRLIAGSEFLPEYRELFGDERADYQQALQRHYDQGPPADWDQRFISAYATMHPWEDWAEIWAHYLHMTDTLETAAAFHLRVSTPEPGQGTVAPDAPKADGGERGFEELMEAWLPLTYALNSLNRGMGLQDLYPFVLAPAVVDKLRFVHRVIASVRRAS